MSEARNGVEDRKRTLETEVLRLRQLGESVIAPLKQTNSSQTEAIKNCMSALEQAVNDTVVIAVDSLSQDLVQAEQELVKATKREKIANVRFIEHLLQHHELPDSQSTVDIGLNPGTAGYNIEVNGSSQLGLRWRFLSNVPQGHPFQKLRKVGDIAPELTIELPEEVGFFRKQVKSKRYRISPLFICSFVHDGSTIQLKLRESPQPEESSGLDVTWTPQTKSVTVARVQKDTHPTHHSITGAGALTLSDLCRKVRDDSLSLIKERGKLLEVFFKDKPFAECDAPTELVSKLISRFGPIVQGIVRHSLMDSELVLKRLLPNGHREEIFASKADLLNKLAIVPLHMRDIFAPLGLGDLQKLTDNSKNQASLESAETAVLKFKDKIPAPSSQNESLKTESPAAASQSGDGTTGASNPKRSIGKNVGNTKTPLAADGPDKNKKADHTASAAPAKSDDKNKGTIGVSEKKSETKDSSPEKTGHHVIAGPPPPKAPTSSNPPFNARPLVPDPILPQGESSSTEATAIVVNQVQSVHEMGGQDTSRNKSADSRSEQTPQSPITDDSIRTKK